MDRALGESEPVTVDDVRQFVERVVPDLFRYLSRLTGGDHDLAEDLVQEACLALFREVRAQEAFRVEPGWMIVVARRRYLDHLRRAGRERARLERVATRPLDAADDPAVSPETLDVDVLAALSSLTAEHRAALVLRYVDDLSVAEVATHLERSIEATKSLLARARQQLSLLLAEADHG